ncbi:TIR domain-containing protein [Archangium lansingense]|uniref:TIR domain-containing protein n=1 Tax=Archangium lansingense TaxID=2995310 RepID=UPI003B7C7E14
MAYDVFISYASGAVKDKRTADAVCATLEKSGIRCWIAPRDILAGEDWGEAIINALNEARSLVLVFSANANSSHQIKREVERAVHRGIPVIPFRIEDVMPSKSLEYFISTPHWLDAMSPPLERHMEHLAEAVRLLLRKPADMEPAPAPHAVVSEVAPSQGEGTPVHANISPPAENVVQNRSRPRPAWVATLPHWLRGHWPRLGVPWPWLVGGGALLLLLLLVLPLGKQEPTVAPKAGRNAVERTVRPRASPAPSKVEAQAAEDESEGETRPVPSKDEEVSATEPGAEADELPPVVRAERLLKSRQYQDAIAVLTEAADQGTKDAKLYELLSVTYLLMGKVSAAEKAYRQGEALEPGFERRFKRRSISEIQPGSQAEQLGLWPGDVLLTYGTVVLPTFEQLQSLTQQSGYGQRRLQVLRKRRVLTFQVKAGPLGIRLGTP